MMYTSTNTQPRGFTLLVAVIFTSVVLAVGMALLDIAYKQVLLASSAKSSQYAFYNSDSALECALFWDQKSNAFDFGSPLPLSTVICNGVAVVPQRPYLDGTQRITHFTVPCDTGTSADVYVYKQITGRTDIYSNGYSTCDASAPTRIERGIRAYY